MLHVNKVAKPENDKLVGRSLVDIAAERGVHPTDAFLDIAASEDLAVEFLWKTETPEWIEGTKIAQDDPHMIVGTSDGGAHLDRDDGAEAHTWFLKHWVREWGGFTLEEGVRQITAIPAALCGFTDRGLLLTGYAADIMIFDPDTVGPDQKVPRPRLPQRRRPLDVEAAGRARHHRQRRPDRARRRAPGRRRPPRPRAEPRHEGPRLDGGARGPRRRRGAGAAAPRGRGAHRQRRPVPLRRVGARRHHPVPHARRARPRGRRRRGGDRRRRPEGAGRRPRRAHHARQLRPVRRLRPRPAHPLPVDDGQAQPPFTVGGEKAFQFANAGVFTERTVVAESQAVVIPKDMPLDAACLIGCAVVTGAGAVLNRAKVQPGETVVVIGAGGIGQSVIQAARLSSAGRIVVIDANPGKEAVARQFGATDFLDGSALTGDGELVAAVKDLGLPDGVDYAFECVGHPALIRNAIDLLDWGGSCVLLGVPKLGTEAQLRGQHALQRQVDHGLPLRQHPPAPRHPDVRAASASTVASTCRAWSARSTTSPTSRRRSTTSTTASSTAACCASSSQPSLSSWSKRTTFSSSAATPKVIAVTAVSAFS